MRAGHLLHRIARNRRAVTAIAFIALIVGMALFAPLLVANDPWAMVQRPFLAPLAEPGYPLGTDVLGRDVAAGVVYGARVSLTVGIAATLVGLAVGVAVGAVAGYFGSWVDIALMRFAELFQAIPGFALAIVSVAIFQPSVTSIIGAIALVSWPPVARLVRSEFLSLAQREYVSAALLAGQSSMRIIFTQILPNAMSPVIVIGSLMVANAILLESALSFLGLGDPNMMSWGYMIGSSRSALRQAWWVAFFPGLAIMITVFFTNLLGEGLREALDTRLHGSRI